MTFRENPTHAQAVDTRPSPRRWGLGTRLLYLWSPLVSPRTSELAEGSSLIVRTSAALPYKFFSRRVVFLHVPAMSSSISTCPLCGLNYKRLALHLPHCKERNDRDYSEFLPSRPVSCGPACGTCSSYGRHLNALTRTYESARPAAVSLSALSPNQSRPFPL